MREEDKIENFNKTHIKNTCHYMCSSITYINIIILIVIIITMYHYLIKYFL